MGKGTGSENDNWGNFGRWSQYNETDTKIARLQGIKVAIMQACNRIENAGNNLHGQQFKIIDDAIEEIRREVGKI